MATVLGESEYEISSFTLGHESAGLTFDSELQPPESRSESTNGWLSPSVGTTGGEQAEGQGSCVLVTSNSR